jgi:hypothetical protein
MRTESGRMWEEVFVAYFKAFSQNLPGRTEESYKQPQKGQAISRCRDEPRNSQIRSRSANHCTAMLRFVRENGSASLYLSQVASSIHPYNLLQQTDSYVI